MISVKIMNGTQAVNDVKRNLAAYTAQVAQTFYEEVKRATPIDKGKARRGWKIQRSNQQWRVNNRVPYIDVLEKGHSKQAPKGMIEPAIQQTMRRIKR
jgi:hypothetical protein